jgi:hypothetical protein
VLIFVQSKERAQELHRELENDDIKVDSIHADRTQAQVKIPSHHWVTQGSEIGDGVWNACAH